MKALYVNKLNMLFRIVLLLLSVIGCSSVSFAENFNKYVGQTFYLPYPKLNVSNAIMYDYKYEPTSHIYIINQSTGEARIYSYFSGSETVKCNIYYTLYDSYGRPVRSGVTAEYHTVTCRSNNITLSAPKSEIDVNDGMQLTYKFETITYDATPQVSYSVQSASPYGCVSVSSSGYVTGRSPGTATIAASSNLGSNTSTVNIRIRAVDPESVKITPEDASVALDESIQLTAKVSPSGASQDVTWSYQDGNSSIATLNNGRVTGVKAGTITVKATAVNGVYGLRKVRVYEPELTRVSSYPSNGDTGLSAFTNPSITFSHNIYSSSNYSSITLKDSRGNVVDGSTTISSRTLTFYPSHPLQPRTKYTLSIPARALKNKWGTDYTSSISLSFTTGDLEKLTLSATSNEKFFAVGDKIKLTCNKSGATIYYTIDGSMPTDKSLIYKNYIEIVEDFRLRAFAKLEGYQTSDYLDVEYKLTNAEIVSKFPDNEMLAVYKYVNPNIRFSNRIKPSTKIEQVKLKNAFGIETGCEIIVADSSIYLIPSQELEIGDNYTVSIPADAVKTKDGESNKSYAWTFNTGDFATAISMGAYELATAIKTDASLMTWGDRYSSGNPANGSVKFTRQGSPAKFINDDVVVVSSGYMHHAVVKTDGSLWMWGRQYCGEFGNKSTTGSSTPLKIMSGVRSVSAGGQTTAIIKTDNTLWMCGRNDFGQIGNGTYDVAKSPVKIMDDVKMAVAGWCVSFAIKDDGSLWSWGRNDHGQIGDGTDSLRLKPVRILDDVALVDASATESKFFAAVKNDGTLWIWGGDNSIPSCVASDVCSVSVGADYVEFVKTDGTLWALGNNDFGQLGSGDTSTSMTPVLIMNDVAEVATGGQTTMALKSDGSVWTWGRNYAGTIGVGSIEASTTAFVANPNCIIDGMSRSLLQGIYCRKHLGIVNGHINVSEMYPIPLNADYESLEWSSDNPDIASVDQHGVVEGRTNGKTDVKCIITDSNGRTFNAICHVLVGTQEEVENMGIDDVLADGNMNVKVWSSDRTIHISNIIPGINIRVFNISGLTFFEGVSDSNELHIPVPISDVYLININNYTYKILCK